MTFRCTNKACPKDWNYIYSCIFVCYISNNTYCASFDGAKDAAYTAKYSQPPEMKEGRGKGKGKGRDGNKGRGGRGLGPLCNKGVERTKGEGKKEREGGMGN